MGFLYLSIRSVLTRRKIEVWPYLGLISRKHIGGDKGSPASRCCCERTLQTYQSHDNTKLEQKKPQTGELSPDSPGQLTPFDHDTPPSSAVYTLSKFSVSTSPLTLGFDSDWISRIADQPGRLFLTANRKTNLCTRPGNVRSERQHGNMETDAPFRC